MSPVASEQTQQVISENWQRVRLQVADACTKAGRAPDDVIIVGVAKYVGPELTAQLVSAGCRVIGENRPQSLWDKHVWFQAKQPPDANPSWHLIGHLQRNKVRRTLPLVDMIQSVDSLRLAQELSLEAVRSRIEVAVLLDVNLTQDSSKTGLTLDEFWTTVQRLVELPGLQLRGLMAMSSLDATPQLIEREFAQVRELGAQLAQKYQLPNDRCELSMGMSGDFREAIAQGSTYVRIGSELWRGVL